MIGLHRMTFHAVGFSDCSSCTTSTGSYVNTLLAKGDIILKKKKTILLCSLYKGTTFCDEIFTIPGYSDLSGNSYSLE